MEPYQERVINELKELAAKWEKLVQFFANPIFQTLPPEEQHRLRRQFRAMSDYKNTLEERIANFSPEAPGSTG